MFTFCYIPKHLFTVKYYHKDVSRELLLLFMYLNLIKTVLGVYISLVCVVKPLLFTDF